MEIFIIKDGTQHPSSTQKEMGVTTVDIFFFKIVVK